VKRVDGGRVTPSAKEWLVFGGGGSGD